MTVLHFVRITVEAVTPLSSGSGEFVRIDRINRETKQKEHKIEVGLIRDANGLPTVLGTSLQGALQHVHAEAYPGKDEIRRNLFGYAADDEGAAARLTVGFGCVHDSRDRAVVGIVFDAERLGDPVLAHLLGDAPVRRDHVRLNARHVADARKKFERLAVPVGTRFSFELTLLGDGEDAERDQASLVEVIGLLRHPAFRLGGAGRRGYGRIGVQRATFETIDLGGVDTIRDRRADPPSVALANTLLGVDGDPPGFPGVVEAKAVLAPVQPWRVGGESKSMTEGTHGIRNRDGTFSTFDGGEPRGPKENVATIVREPQINWTAAGANLVVPGGGGPFAFVVPGSAIKGPLAHRSLFHWNRSLAGGAGLIDVETWQAAGREERLAALAELPGSLQRLFGYAKERSVNDGGHESPKGQAARLLIDDAQVKEVQYAFAVDHNSIDRFTGGVRSGLLYAEEVLAGGQIELTIAILALPNEQTWDEATAKSFLLALRDLCCGRLAIGAKSLGFCTGAVAWSGHAALKDTWETWATAFGVPRLETTEGAAA